MRAVLVENMLVRREADNLYLPAAPRCLLGGDRPNVVAVVAGAYRLWDEFMAKSRSARSSW